MLKHSSSIFLALILALALSGDFCKGFECTYEVSNSVGLTAAVAAPIGPVTTICLLNSFTVSVIFFENNDSEIVIRPKTSGDVVTLSFNAAGRWEFSNNVVVSMTHVVFNSLAGEIASNLFIIRDNSHLTLTKCNFNNIEAHGSMISVDTSTLILRLCEFVETGMKPNILSISEPRGSNIYANDSIITVENCLFSQAIADYDNMRGGVIAMDGGDLIFQDSECSDILTGGSGGCIHAAEANVTISNSLFRDINLLLIPVGGDNDFDFMGVGSAILAGGRRTYITITNCVFEGNNGEAGVVGIIGVDGDKDDGGNFLLNEPGSILLHNCTFRNNTGELAPALVNFSNLKVTDCRFDTNQATRKSMEHSAIGAFLNYFGEASFNDCLFQDNYAGTGGAVGLGSGTLRLTDCQFIGNVAAFNGGAILVLGEEDASELFLNNVSFMNNRAGFEPVPDGFFGFSVNDEDDFVTPGSGGVIQIFGASRVIMHNVICNTNDALSGGSIISIKFRNQFTQPSTYIEIIDSIIESASDSAASFVNILNENDVSAQILFKNTNFHRHSDQGGYVFNLPSGSFVTNNCTVVTPPPTIPSLPELVFNIVNHARNKIAIGTTTIEHGDYSVHTHADTGIAFLKYNSFILIPDAHTFANYLDTASLTEFCDQCNAIDPFLCRAVNGCLVDESLICTAEAFDHDSLKNAIIGAPNGVATICLLNSFNVRRILFQDQNSEIIIRPKNIGVKVTLSFETFDSVEFRENVVVSFIDVIFNTADGSFSLASHLFYIFGNAHVTLTGCVFDKIVTQDTVISVDASTLIMHQCEFRYSGIMSDVLEKPAGSVLYSNDSTITIEKCLFSHAVANYNNTRGGVMAIDGGTFIFDESECSDISTGGTAGCIQVLNSHATISNSLFRNITMFSYDWDGDLSGMGIAIVAGTLHVPIIIVNCIFEDNIGEVGAVAAIGMQDEIVDMESIILNDPGTLFIRDCVFRNNAAHYAAALVSVGKLQVENCTFYNNSASIQGNDSQNVVGAYLNYAGEATFLNCVFKENSARLGGAVGIMSLLPLSKLVLQNCQFLDNKADYNGGAIFAANLMGGTPDITLENVIFTGNIAGFEPAPDVYPGFYLDEEDDPNPDRVPLMPGSGGIIQSYGAVRLKMRNVLCSNNDAPAGSIISVLFQHQLTALESSYIEIIDSEISSPLSSTASFIYMNDQNDIPAEVFFKNTNFRRNNNQGGSVFHLPAGSFVTNNCTVVTPPTSPALPELIFDILNNSSNKIAIGTTGIEHGDYSVHTNAVTGIAFLKYNSFIPISAAHSFADYLDTASLTEFCNRCIEIDPFLCRAVNGCDFEESLILNSYSSISAAYMSSSAVIYHSIRSRLAFISSTSVAANLLTEQEERDDDKKGSDIVIAAAAAGAGLLILLTLLAVIIRHRRIKGQMPEIGTLGQGSFSRSTRSSITSNNSALMGDGVNLKSSVFPMMVSNTNQYYETTSHNPPRRESFLAATVSGRIDGYSNIARVQRPSSEYETIASDGQNEIYDEAGLPQSAYARLDLDAHQSELQPSEINP